MGESARFVEDPTALTTSFFAIEPVATVNWEDVRALGDMSAEQGGPARYNLHSSPADELHCMVIAQPAGAYAQPRKHLTKSKSFHLVSGEVILLTFKDDGSLRGLHRLAFDELLMVRVGPGIYHTNYTLSGLATYHEVIAGPYERDSDDRRYAPFAPPQEDHVGGKVWIESVIGCERPELLARCPGR